MRLISSFSHAFCWSTTNQLSFSSSLLVQEGVSFCLEGFIFSQSIMPQLDKFTYFTQFFWLCLFFFTFYISLKAFLPFNLEENLYLFFLRCRGFRFIVFFLKGICILFLVVQASVRLFESVLVLLNDPSLMLLQGQGGIAPYILKMDPGAPAPGDPGIPLIPIPELQHPLIPDEVRMRELETRLVANSIGMDLTPEKTVDIITSQAVIEKKVEAALVADGFRPATLLEKRDQLRGFLFYPRGTVLSQKTYLDHLKSIDWHGTRACIPYRRVVEAIRRSELFL